MKVQILQENLHKALGLIDKFVSTKTQLPVLSNVLLTANNEGFFVTATNLETGIRIRIGSKIINEGSTTVPAKIFNEFIGTLPSETISLNLDEENLEVECQSFKASFQGISASEYPDFPKKVENDGKNISLITLKKVVDKVGFSASSDDSRPVLTGMLWDVSKEKVSVVCTDGYRLSALNLLTSSLGEIEKSLLIPAFVLREVSRVFGETEGDELSFSWSEKERQIFFFSKDVEIVSRVLDGEFPNYNAVIPSDQSNKITFIKQDLNQAVKMAAIFARESANIIRWKFSDGVLNISANSPQVGKNVAVVNYEGDKIEEKEIAFNSRYLLDLFSHIESEEIVFSMTEPLRPGVFFEKGNEKEFLHVIMPVRVQS